MSSDFLIVVVTVPLITAFIGYVTNWAAVKMIFHPEQFVGVGKLGWQGVLPSRADQFAQDVADNATSVLSARDLAERLDPAEMEELFSERLDEHTPVLVREAAEIIQPGFWDQMAPEAQQMVVAQIREEGKKLAREVFDDLQGISDELLDLRQLIVDLLSGENVNRLVRLFQQIGGKELKFIEYYGGIFGFAVGCVQVAAFSVFNQWWLMPIIGVVVGLGTNWLALQMIFRPMEPRRILGVTWQGMFPKRQAEIAADYGRIAAAEILTPANLMRLVTEGEAGTRVARMVLTKVSERIDESRPMIEMMTSREVTDDAINQVKWRVVQYVGERVPEVQPEIEDYVGRALDVENLVRSRLEGMTKPEFERLLRGIFEQDEIILIVIGGVLGGAVGVLQGAVVLATGA